MRQLPKDLFSVLYVEFLSPALPTTTEQQGKKVSLLRSWDPGPRLSPLLCQRMRSKLACQ